MTDYKKRRIIHNNGPYRIGMSYYLLLAIYKVLLSYAYVNIVQPIYAYTGFRINTSLSASILGWIIFIIFAWINRTCYFNKDIKISSEVLNLMMLMAGIPFTVMVGAGCFSNSFIIANSIFWIVLYAFTIGLRHISLKGSFISFGHYKLGEKQINIILIIAALIVIYISGRYTHFRFNFDLLSVYEFRQEVTAFHLPRLLTYIYSWTRAILTILIAFYYRKGKYGLVVACFVIQLLSFGIDGSKSVFFYAIAAIIINILPKYEPKTINRFALASFSGLTGLSIIIYFVFHNYIVSSIFVRRVMFLPVMLESYYYDFFSTNTPDFYRGSFLRGLGFETPYPSLATIIGRIYFNSPDMGANNGLISDAMANLGFAGIIIVPLFYAITLKVLDAAAKGLDIRLYLATSLYICTVWINSFFFATLITHGVLVIIIMLSLMEKEESFERRTGHEYPST